MSEDSTQPARPAAHAALRSGPVHAATRTTMRAVGAVALVAATAAVTMPAGLPDMAANAWAALSGTAVDGVWRADGQGLLVTVRKGRLQTFDTTSVGCSPGPRAGWESDRPGPDGTVSFADDGGRPLLTIRLQGVGIARMRLDGTVGEIGLRRLPGLPAGC